MNVNAQAHIVGMVNSRATRRALGFSDDRCRRLKIAPCRLRVRPHFERHLSYLCLLRARRKSVLVYDKVNRCQIAIGFNSQQYVGFGRENMHYLQTWLQIKTHMVIDVKTTRLFEKAYSGGQCRRYYYDPFSGECVRMHTDDRTMTARTSYNGFWQLLIKPKFGHLYAKHNLLM